MKTLFTFLLGCILLPVLSAQQDTKFTISGYIEDAESGEKLISANLYEYQSEKGTITNTYGFLNINNPNCATSVIPIKVHIFKYSVNSSFIYYVTIIILREFGDRFSI